MYEYEFDTDNAKELHEYNTEWLDFITRNRHEGEKEIAYDLIYDRIADSTGDELVANIESYWHKEKSAEEVVKAIKFRNGEFDQYFKYFRVPVCVK